MVTKTRSTERAPITGAILAVIMIAALALRFYHIDQHGLFVDEIYSVLVATGKADPELISFDAARPFYFFLLNNWLYFGSSEYWLRLLSLIFSAANILLVYRLAKSLADKPTALIAALLMALSPLEIHYSQLVRMYSLGNFLALCGSLALLKAVDSAQKNYLAVWTFSRALMLLTLPLTALLLPVDLALVWHKRKQSDLVRPMLCSFAALLLLWSPYLWILLKAQASPYDSWRSVVDVPDFADFLTLLINFTASAIPLGESGGPPAFDLCTTIYVLLFPLALLASFFSSPKKPRMLWSLLWGLAPLAVLFAWSNIARPLFITRYTMFTAPYILIILAFGATQIWQRYRIAGLILLLSYGLAMGAYIPFYYKHPVHEDWRVVANYLEAHVKPGDEIVVWNYHSRYVLGYYYHGKNHISDMQAEMGRDNAQTDEYVRLDLDLKPVAKQRLWLVSREALPGWEEMYKAYGLYKQAINKRFDVLGTSNQAMMDIYEVKAR